MYNMDKFSKDSRLSRDTTYQRPPTTYQQSLTNDEIKEKLSGYVKVEEINRVPVGSHLRYFLIEIDPETQKKKKLFRTGGFLKNKDNSDKYVVLSNGTKSWSVNTQKCVFFRKMKQHEMEDKYEKEIKRLEAIIQNLK